MKFLHNVSPMLLFQQKFGKITIISGFALILSLVITIILTPAEPGYEYSIFGMFPIYFWIIFFTVIVMGIYLMFSGLCNPRNSIYGVLMLMLCYIIFFFYHISKVTPGPSVTNMIYLHTYLGSRLSVIPGISQTFSIRRLMS